MYGGRTKANVYQIDRRKKLLPLDQQGDEHSRIKRGDSEKNWEPQQNTKI